jgi:hypothetical protein
MLFSVLHSLICETDLYQWAAFAFLNIINLNTRKAIGPGPRNQIGFDFVINVC